MDLKLVDVTLQADIGNFDGTGIELLTYLREVALTDLNSMLDLEMGVDEGEFEDYEEFPEDIYTPEEGLNEGFEREPSEEYEDLPETSDDAFERDDVSELLDSDIGNKIIKFAEVIMYFDSIVSTNGIVDDENAITTMLNEFKKLDGIYNTYGDFTFSTSFTVA